MIRPRLLALLFLLCALPTGLGCALLTPIGDTPDEPQHIARADGLRLGEVLGFQPAGQEFPGVNIAPAIFEVAVSEVFATAPDKPLPAAVRQHAQALTWSPGEVFCPTQMVNYFPVFYVPGALGLWVGETLGLTPLHTVFLGRLFMLAAYLALGTAALALARAGGALLFALLTLPTALTLGASYNHDGLIIAASALAAALLTRATAGVWWGAFGIIELMACAKAPYGPLMLACLPPVARRDARWRVVLLGLSAIPAALWLLRVLHGGFSPWPRPPYAPGPLWPGPRGVMFSDIEPARNIAVLMAHPAQILLLPLTSLWVKWYATWPQILGMVGWDRVPLWPWEFPSLAVAVLAAGLGAMLGAAPVGWRRWDTACAALALFGTFIAVALSQYVSFTNAGDAVIIGVYGRYFLPFLPFLILLLPGLLPRKPALPAGIFVLPALVMAGINIIALPAFLLHVYAMPGP